MLKRRRVRLLLVSSLALGLVSTALGLSPWSGAATGSDPDAVISLSDATPLAGGDLTVSVTGLPADAVVGLQLCAGNAHSSPGAEPLPWPNLFDPAGCRELGDVATNGDGSGAAVVQLPADGFAAGGLCVYEPGEGSFSFGAGSFSFGSSATMPCQVAAVTDTDTSDGIDALATARVHVRAGTGSITGTVRDAGGAPLPPEAAGALQVCSLGAQISCEASSTSSPLVEWGPDGVLQVSGLADGQYTVVATYSDEFGQSGDLRTATVTGGAQVDGTDLRMPDPGDTSYASSGSGVALSVSPASDIPFDAPLQVEATGYAPGDTVDLFLCAQRPFVDGRVLSGGYHPYCWTRDVPVASVVADATGAISTALPYDVGRFTNQCPDVYRGGDEGSFSFGGPSFSFGGPGNCYLAAIDRTGAPSVAWQELAFRRPAGEAAVSGTVSADGVPVAAARLQLQSPVGHFWQGSGADGSYRLGGLPDGQITVSAQLPSNYHYAELVEDDPGSFSFGATTRTKTVVSTIEGQQDVVADFDFDIDPGGVSGIVRRAGGDPAGGAQVYIYSLATDSYFSLYGTAAEDGSYDFLGLPDGRYRVEAYSWSDDEGYYDYSVRSDVTVAGGILTGVDLRFPATNGSIAGAVTTPEGDPVAGSYVYGCLEDDGGTYWASCRYVQTDQAGTFRLPRLQAGTWRVTAYTPFNYLSQVSTLVEVGEDEAVTGVSLGLPVLTGSIAGTVRDEDGEPVAGASIWACSTSTEVGGCGSSVTGEDGTYRLSGVPDGQYTVSAASETSVQTSVAATVSGGGATGGVDLVLRPLKVVPPNTSVGGVTGGGVTGGAGAVFPDQPSPVTVAGQCPGAQVSYTLQGADGALWASGALAESPVTPGDYAGEVPAQEGRSGRGLLTITVDCPEGTVDPQPVEIDVYIDPSGNVVDTEGQPVEGATVTLSRADTETGPFEPVPDGSSIMSPENRTNPDLTDETGYFGWLTVPGFYKVRAEKDGCTAPGDPATAFVETPPLPVPPEQVGLELVLDCSGGSEDSTPPVVSLSLSAEPNDNGWHGAAVTATVEATDPGSGVATSTLVIGGAETGTTTQELGAGEHTVAARAVDGAGNSATTEPTVVRVDLADPTATVTSPEQGQSVPVGAQLPVGFSCADADSGVDTCVGDAEAGAPLDTTTPGEKSFSVTATDLAGRTATSTITYTVTAAATDDVSLAFSGGVRGTWAGPVTGGDLEVTHNAFGQVDAVRGRVEVPGRDGGTAAVRIDVQRLLFFNAFVGEIRLIDRTARVDQRTPILFGGVSESRDGTVSGSANWVSSSFAPYRLRWSARDAPTPAS